MSVQIVWLVLLGLMLSGYFVLAGYDYGTQMLYSLVGRDASTRRVTRGALGPFFFGNEVWLVAFVGVLFGAFPLLEGELLAGLYPLLILLLAGLVVGKAAVQLRGRMESPSAGRLFDLLIVFGGLVPAMGWGLVVGLLLRGVPLRDDGTFTLGWSEVLDPFVVSAGLSNVLLLAAHGATFLSMRARGEVAQRARNLARPLLISAIVAVLATALLGGRTAVTRPVIALALAGVLVAALLGALVAAALGPRGSAFAATSVAALLPVPLIFASLYPFILVSHADGGPGLTVAEAAADSGTLRMLLPVGAVVIPVVIACQVMSWWLFRGRVGHQTPSYF
ncbi:cytochrome d ubiquinol oxidase subunit II [Nocardia tenerifensis]|uniref:Cytochrome d ubiquinol oxidase subunit II n=1 Tax=Nocardia tenerifensis TaxID=228006 RepID=A0A318JRR9_9NOCA|nr:cytochrome d ubiquinol oxidase subunit II [Nocardia tenerifensis]PXX58675.1 cytochrome d ubiquinol oxidase subunit II [Nocardia tenerifensis]